MSYSVFSDFSDKNITLFGRVVFCTVGSLHHPAHLAPQRLPLPISGDDAVHLAGGLHGEDEMVACQMAAEHLVHAVGHTRGQGIAHQIAVAHALGSVLAEDGELFTHAILEDGGIPSADLAANGLGLHVAVDLPNGALLQKHQGESAVDHGGGGDDMTVLRQSGGNIPHTGDGQLGGEDEVGQTQPQETGGGGGVGGVEAEIPVEGDLTVRATGGHGLADQGQMADIAHQNMADAALQGGGQLFADIPGLAVEDHGGHEDASLSDGNGGGVSLAQGEIEEIEIADSGGGDLLGGVEAGGALDLGYAAALGMGSLTQKLLGDLVGRDGSVSLGGGRHSPHTGRIQGLQSLAAQGVETGEGEGQAVVDVACDRLGIVGGASRAGELLFGGLVGQGGRLGLVGRLGGDRNGGVGGRVIATEQRG